MSRSVTPDLAPRRPGQTLAALVLGLPLAAGLIFALHSDPLRQSFAFRYVEHPVQWVEIIMFSCALGALISRFWRIRIDAHVCGREVLPKWDGTPLQADQANTLAGSINRLSARLQDTYLVRRIRSVLNFLTQRKSASQLDDHLRDLVDTDLAAMDNGYALVRFITWAIPILGFLGTVLGITSAIAGVTPEVLEESMSGVTDGLAEAFDSTALALALTMLTMFLTYLVEKKEQGVIEEVDHIIHHQLSHRFKRDETDVSPMAEVMRQSTLALTQAVEAIGQRLAEPEKHAAQVHEQLRQAMTEGVQAALEQTLAAHAQRMQSLEQHSVQSSAGLMQQLAALAVAVRDTGREQQQTLIRVAEGIAGQAAAIGKLQEGEANLVHLQAVLHQNLAALASAGSFEEAVHSLTAAVHMLTARAGAPAPRAQTLKAA